MKLDFCGIFEDLAGWTALMYACYYGHEDVINVLLNHSDIDVNARNAYGYTVTMIAHKKGHQHIIQLIKSKLKA